MTSLENEALKHGIGQEKFTTKYAGGASISSEYHPERNEDSYLVDQENGVYAIFDGMGGVAGGEIASRVALNTLRLRNALLSQPIDPQSAAGWIAGTLYEANSAIIQEHYEAATTAVIVKIQEYEDAIYATVGHVGDSRAYIMRDGALKMVTTDHTPFRQPGHTLEAMVQQEKLASVVDPATLSQTSLKAFTRRNVIGAYLGYDNEIKSDIKHFMVQPGDIVLLTSDGIHDNLTLQEMEEIIAASSNEDLADILTKRAGERAAMGDAHARAKPDDMTAVVVEI